MGKLKRGEAAVVQQSLSQPGNHDIVASVDERSRVRFQVGDGSSDWIECYLRKEDGRIFVELFGGETLILTARSSNVLTVSL